MRLFLLLAFLTILSVPAAAQDMLREHRADDPAARLLDEDYKAPETIGDYANLYYESCTGANTDKSMKEYTETQCGCTAAELPKFMTLNNMKSLFTKTKEGDFQQARVMMLAYIPCLYTSVSQFVFDGCFYSDARKKFVRPRKVCECYGHRVADYIAKNGENFVPGFRRGTFDSEKAVPNPLSYIVTSHFFESQSRHEFEQCVFNEEYRFNK